MPENYDIRNYTANLYSALVPKYGPGRFGSGIYLTPSIAAAEFASKSGPIAEMRVSGKALVISDYYLFLCTLVEEDADAEEAFDETHDIECLGVTSRITQWASEQGLDLVVIESNKNDVITPYDQVVVLKESAIKSYSQKGQKVTATVSFDDFIDTHGEEIYHRVLAASAEVLNRYNLRPGRIFGKGNGTERYKVIELSGNTVYYKNLGKDRVEYKKVDALLSLWNDQGIVEITYIDEILDFIKKNLTPFLGGAMIGALISWLIGKLK